MTAQDKRTDHRVTVWAGGVNGTPVSCVCGWKAYAKNKAAGYALKSAHEKTASEFRMRPEEFEPWYR